MKSIRVYGLTCVLSLLALAAQATTIVMPTDEQLIAKSPLVVEGTVVSTRPVDRNGSIWTETTVAVTRTIKGEVPDTIVVAEAGGALDDRITKIYGAAEFETGERVLLFLEPAPSGGYRTMDLYIGKFSEGKTADGRRLWLRSDIADNVLLLDAGFRPLRASNVQRDATGFETYIHDRARGRAGNANYGVENPILERRNRAITANFTLIDEPNVYRWFTFDNGGSANWQSSGTQTGYSGGGVNELQTAMAAWNSYASAKIRYAYTGAMTAAPAGLESRNSINEVLFNDPLNEISGAWSSGTGGVVGRGGFNGVTNGGTFTATFAADAAHPAGSIRAYNIVEGNLTIQNGVAPSAGISSSRLAEILSHEFGHTLGFGHSSDSSALMYATVVGLGPQLRDDDKLAARWLYPNGSGGDGGGGDPAPTRPAAPTNLTATVSGTSVALQWADNATNEDGYSVYVASGSGAFTKIGDLAANSRSTTVNGFTTGSYRIYVAAFNDGGEASSNTVTVAITINVNASFSFTPQNGLAGVTNFTFYDESTGPVASRVWSFGDGATSTAAVATHIYATPGTYNVTLGVTGGGTQSQTTRTVVVNGALTASFTFAPPAPTTNDTVVFSDTSTGGVTSWYWTFGDGGSSTSQHPTRRYSAAGRYNVTLTVYRNSESHSTMRTIDVTAGGSSVTPSVTAAFDFQPAAPVAGTNVTLFDRSAGAPTSWSWNFGDGRTSIEQNPTVSWPVPGTYTVSLTASNATSQSMAQRTIVVAGGARRFRSLVSVTAATSGVGGTSWRTELTLFNPGAGTFVDLIYIPGAGVGIQTRRHFLGARQSVTYGNALREIFNVETGAGALAIEAEDAGGVPDLKIASRTFTDGNPGTYGQAVPTVDMAVLDRTLYLTGIQSGSAYRTNLGIVNRSESAVSTTLTLLDGNGATLATANIAIPAGSFQQASLAAYFPAIAAGSFDVLSLRSDASEANAVSVYASVVDNRTQDPIYIQAVAAASGSALTLPVVGRSPGANGTYWRSDVTLFNPGPGRITLGVHYRGGDAASSKTMSVDAGRTIVLADVLAQFGLAFGSGLLELTWSGTNGPVVTSRTYTSIEGGGTYGQSIDAVSTFGREVFIPGLRNDSGYRSNVGFVNDSMNAFEVTVRLLSQQGVEVASKTISLAAKSQTQTSLAALFPGFSGTYTLHASADGSLFAYGSMVDNASGDPVFFAGS